MHKELSKDAAVYFISFFIPAVTGIFSIPIITNLISPDEYGRYVLLLSSANLLAMMGTGWIGASILRFYNRYESTQIDTFNSSIFGLSILASLISLVIAVFLFQLDADVLSPDLMVLGILLFLGIAWYNMVGYFARAQRHVVLFSIIKIINSILGVAVGVGLCVYYDVGTVGLVWGLIVSNYLSFLLLVIYTKFQFSVQNKHDILAIIKQVARYGLPLIIVNAVSWMLVWADRYILGILKDNVQVGIYSASYGLADKSIIAIVTVFKLAAMPLAFKTWETGSRQDSEAFISNLARFFLLICVPLLAMLNALAEPIVQVMTEAQYHAGYKIIPFISLGSFFLGLQVLYSIGLSFHNKTKWMMYYNIIGIIVNAVLNILFIPTYGYMAAAASTFVTMLVVFLISLFVSRLYFKWTFPIFSFVRICLSAAVMSLANVMIYRFFHVPQLLSLIFAMLSGFLVYGAVLIMLREVKLDELQKLLGKSL